MKKKKFGLGKFAADVECYVDFKKLIYLFVFLFMYSYINATSAQVCTHFNNLQFDNLGHFIKGEKKHFYMTDVNKSTQM